MRLLVSGARIWDDVWTVEHQLETAWFYNPELTIVHGAARNGADRIAVLWAVRNNVIHEPHPANWLQYGKAAGHIRNKEMVDSKPDYAMFFIKGESKGTLNCLGHAQKAGIPHAIFRAEQC